MKQRKYAKCIIKTYKSFLACPPQPTEDSSSSPTDPPNDNNNNEHFQGAAGTSNMQSDSDDRHSFAFAFKMRQAPNFESDSLNENFSPSRYGKVIIFFSMPLEL